jgi:hypothetical protein
MDVYFVSVDSSHAKPTAFVGASDVVTLRLLGSVHPAPASASIASAPSDTQLYVRSAGVLR